MAGVGGAASSYAGLGLQPQQPTAPALPPLGGGAAPIAPGGFQPNPLYASAFGPVSQGFDPYQQMFAQQQQQALQAQQFLGQQLQGTGYGGLAAAAGTSMLNQGLGQDAAAQSKALGDFLTTQEQSAEQLAMQGLPSDQVKAMLQARAEAFGVPLPTGAFGFLDSLYQGKSISPLAANTGLPSMYQDAIKSYVSQQLTQNPKMKQADVITAVTNWLQTAGQVSPIAIEAYRPEIEQAVKGAITAAPPAPLGGMAGLLQGFLGQVPGLAGAAPTQGLPSPDAGLNLQAPSFGPFGQRPTGPLPSGPTFMGPRP